MKKLKLAIVLVLSLVLVLLVVQKYCFCSGTLSWVYYRNVVGRAAFSDRCNRFFLRINTWSPVKKQGRTVCQRATKELKQVSILMKLQKC